MMVGAPGAGKSFFARHFAQMFGAPAISADRLRFELFAEPQFTADEQDILSRLAQYQLDELLKTRATIIVDGFCNAKTERQTLASLAKKAGYGTLAVWVQTHQTTAQSRVTKRNSRRADDAHNVSLSPEEFTRQARRLTPPTTENHVVISGMHTYNTQAKTVLRKLIQPRQAAAQSQPIQVEPRPSEARQQTRRSVVIR